MATKNNFGTRQQRQHAKALERRAWQTGRWGEWRITGLPSSTGWCRDIREVWANDLYAVLVRPVDTRWGKVHHCAIRTASNLEPPWRDKQRIKDEIFGPDTIAVEVMPETQNIVDEADMYHIWVLPDGFEMPFTLVSKRAATAPDLIAGDADLIVPPYASDGGGV